MEYFFHQLDRQGRLIVDSILRVISMALFGVLSWRSWLYGMRMLETGQVTATLQVPLFWVPMVIAVSFALVVPVVLHHLLYPGREMIRP